MYEKPGLKSFYGTIARIGVMDKRTEMAKEEKLLFTPEPRTCCVAAGEHPLRGYPMHLTDQGNDSGGSLGFAKRIFMPKLLVTGHGVNSNQEKDVNPESQPSYCNSRTKCLQ